MAGWLILGQSPAASEPGVQQKLSQAATLARLHRFADAERALRGVAQPDDPRQAIAFHRLRAAIGAGLHKPEQASAEMHAALKLSPEDPGLLRATALADLIWLDAQLKAPSHGQLAATLSTLRALPLPDKEEAELRSKMGERLLAARDFRDAISDLSELVRLDPLNAEAWAQLADAQFRGRDPKAALASALRAKALGDKGELEALLGDIYELSGDSVAAARSFEAAVRLSPRDERFRLALAVELMKHQTFEPAAAILERSEIDFPKSPRTRTALGLTLYLSGKEREGTAKLMEAAALDPDFIPPVRYLGRLALAEAAVPAERVVETECRYADAHPSDYESNAACGGLEARVAAQASGTADWRSILARLAGAAAGSPASSIARCEYGKVLDQTHDWRRARTELEACVLLAPDSVEAHYRLSRIYRRLGLKELANTELAARSAAERRLAESNNAREQSVRGFLYTLGSR